jgi:hypothetical protein
MAKKFLHLGVSFKSGGATPERLNEVEGVLNKATDWLRYARGCWLIYTGKEPNVWHNRLKNQVSWIKDQSYLICEVDLENRAGWLPETAWDWIKKDRTQ